MPNFTDGPHVGDPPTVLQSDDAVELNRALAEAQERIRDLEAVIEADRTRIIDGVNALEKVLRGRFWLTEGRGSYEWNDDRYRKEFGDAARAVLKAVEPLRKIGADLTNCPPTTDEVIAARRNKDARIAELERALERIDSTVPVITKTPNSVIGVVNVEAYWAMQQEARNALASTAPEPREESCHICGKLKGQPPERCPGHYSGTPSDPANFASTPASFTPAPEHPDTRRLDGVPGDLAEAILRMGRIEWGSTREQIDMEHLNDFADTLRITREAFPLGEKTKINGCYLEGTTTVLCHTGNSPNSPNNARIIVGLWNQLHDTLKTIDAATKEAADA